MSDSTVVPKPAVIGMVIASPEVERTISDQRSSRGRPACTGRFQPYLLNKQWETLASGGSSDATTKRGRDWSLAPLSVHCRVDEKMFTRFPGARQRSFWPGHHPVQCRAGSP